MTETRPAHVQDLEVLSAFLKAEALNATGFNDAMVCAALYGRVHWDNISGFFSDPAFETALFDRWQHVLNRRAKASPTTDSPQNWCHILTRAYAYGGHTRLFKQLSTALADHDLSQTLIVTQKAAADVMKGMPAALGRLRMLKGNPLKKARALYDAAWDADVVALFHHPDDIVTAFVARALAQDGVRVLFVNHADHVFSFGADAADGVLEICATGWNTTQARRKAKAQHFMGIPIVSAQAAIAPIRTNRSGPILSIGGPGKFKPSTAMSFPDFLDHLLERVPNDVVLIGPSAKDPWWEGVTTRFPGRIHLMGIQPAETVQTEFQRAACYVDSFPLDGGTVFPEAVMAGLPAFGPNKRSAPGVSPTDALRCDGLDPLLEDVVTYLTGGPPPAALADVQAHIRQDFSTEAVLDRVFRAIAGQANPLPDYLAELGNRGADYNADNWREAGQFHFPKRAWRRLSWAKKLRIRRKARDLALTPGAAQQLKRRIFLG